MASSYTALYLQMKLKDPRRLLQRAASDVSYGTDAALAQTPTFKSSPPCHNPGVPSGGSQKMKSAPVGTIAPTKAACDLWRSAEKQPFGFRPSQDHSGSPAYLLKEEQKNGASHYLQRGVGPEPAFPASMGLLRPGQHDVYPGNKADVYPSGFHPYLSKDAIRPVPTYPNLSIDLNTASYYYPGFVPHLTMPSSIYSHYEDPYYLSMRSPCAQLPEKSNFPPGQAAGLPLNRKSSDDSEKSKAVRFGRQQSGCDGTRNKEEQQRSRTRGGKQERPAHHLTRVMLRSQESLIDKEQQLKDATWESSSRRKREGRNDKPRDDANSLPPPRPCFQRQGCSRSPYFSPFLYNPLHFEETLPFDQAAKKWMHPPMAEAFDHLSFGRRFTVTDLQNTSAVTSSPLSRPPNLAFNSSLHHHAEGGPAGKMTPHERDNQPPSRRDIQSHLQKHLNKKGLAASGGQSSAVRPSKSDVQPSGHNINLSSAAAHSWDILRKTTEASSVLDFSWQSENESKSAKPHSMADDGQSPVEVQAPPPPNLSRDANSAPAGQETDPSGVYENQRSGLHKSQEHNESLDTPQEECLDLSINPPAGHSDFQTSSLPQSQSLPKTGGAENELSDGEPVTLGSAQGRLDSLEINKKPTKCRGSSYHCDYSSSGTYKQRMSKLIRRLARHSPLKLGSTPGKMVFLELLNLTRRKELKLEQWRKRRLLRRSQSSVIRPAEKMKKALCQQERQRLLDQTGTMNPEEKQQFLAMFDLKPLSPHQRREKAPNSRSISASSAIGHNEAPFQTEETHTVDLEQQSQLANGDRAATEEHKEPPQWMTTSSPCGRTSVVSETGPTVHTYTSSQFPVQVQEVNGSLDVSCTGEHVRIQSESSMSEEEEEEEEEVEMVGQAKWQGIDAIFETYIDYAEERDLEKDVLLEQLRFLKEKNEELHFRANNLRSHIQGLEENRQKLNYEREHHLASLDLLKKNIIFTL
ncbi:genetic suppressor element 1-like isoform X1 [Polypterus senegalus]|uniref:genetic suppressor element 1-like isoform X1 n=2 Tax=Polypterus senegalus TaxID=55291 RepID=UPI001964A51F|nr:genetic suppressor element 1-like isoform X1 [Polypterus senegalus]